MRYRLRQVWNRVDSDMPNFHVPESFGALVLG